MNISLLRGSFKCWCHKSSFLLQHLKTDQLLRSYLSSGRKCPYCFLTGRIVLPQNTTSLVHLQNNRPLLAQIHSTISKMNEELPKVEELSKKDKFKRAIKDYGATVLIFHITISLMSLGTSYLIISSGVDVPSLLAKVGLDKSDLAAGASTFVVAYAVHKVFAPVRLSITLASTPFIVRYLRRIGILKPPKTTGT